MSMDAIKDKFFVFNDDFYSEYSNLISYVNTSYSFALKNNVNTFSLPPIIRIQISPFVLFPSQNAMVILNLTEEEHDSYRFYYDGGGASSKDIDLTYFVVISIDEDEKVILELCSSFTVCANLTFKEFASYDSLSHEIDYDYRFKTAKLILGECDQNSEL